MATKRTISIGFKIEDGEGGFKRITADAKEMRTAIRESINDTDTFTGRLRDIGGKSFGIDAITNALHSLHDAMASSVDAYNVQLEAEKKLETVMRQRMAATEAEIASIKELCSTQQMIGVIGDEVQLAGAQQISTFITQKDTLALLIPAMNNLVAQQKGLNATSGDTVTIGNLLGKAMQGQTSALRRVGITFTEAEEKAIKYGTEIERAAALAKVIKNNVGEMNAELAKTSAGKLKQISNDMGDLQERVGGMVKDLMPAVTMVNQVVMAWGNFSKVSAGAQSAMKSILGFKSSLQGATVQVKIFDKTLTATTATTRLMALTFKGAMAVMKSALITTGIGAALWVIGEGIGLIINSLTGVEDAAKDAGDALDAMKEEQQELNRVQVNTQAQLTQHIAEIKNFTGTKEQERQKVEELNRIYGESMGCMSDLSQWYTALTSQSELFCKQMVLQARAQMLAKKMAEGQTMNYNLNRNAEKFNETNLKSDNPLVKIGNESLQKSTKVLSEGIRKSVDDLGSQLDDVMQEIAQIGQEMKSGVSDALKGDKGKTAGIAGTSKLDTLIPKDSIADYKKQLSELDTKISLEPDPANAAVLEMEKAKVAAKLSRLEFLINFRFKYGNDLEAIKAEIGKMPITAPLKLEVDKDQLNATLRSIPRTIERGTDSANDLGTALAGVGKIGQELGNIFSGLGDAFESPELNIAGIIAGAIANIASGAAAAIAQSASMGPFGWAAFSLAATAQMVGMIAQLKKATAFANGGIVSGPTMALVGEYAGASNNPEVIAPLDKLRSMIGSPRGAQTVIVGGDVRIKGSDLMIALRNQRSISKVSGRGEI